MNPKVEVVRMLVEKKGGVLATFTAKVTFDEKYQVHFPNMRVMDGTKGRFVSAPTRKSGEDFIPLYFLNKELLDLLRRAGMEAFDKATTGKGSIKPGPMVPAAAVATKPAVAARPAAGPGPAKSWVRREWKTTTPRLQTEA